MATLSPVDSMPMASMQMRQRKETPSLFMMRPVSNVTDFVDLWDAEDSGSEFEEDSPRESFDSGMDRSQSTATSYAVHTPAIERKNDAAAFDVRIRRQESISTHGPAGPDLFFRTSFDSANEFVFQMSPLMPKEAELTIDELTTPRPFVADATASTQPAEYDDADDFTLDPVSEWNPQQVASWMQSVGIDHAIIARFEENDIDGEVLLALHFDDLKELGIPSFGKRHQIWAELGNLHKDASLSPVPTAFEDVSDPPTSQPAQVQSSKSRRGRRGHLQGSDPVAPGDSISIVAIEQLIPRPHKCSRGEKCPKWRKQQRMLQQLDEEYGLTISPTGGGHIFMAGYPGNADTAEHVVDSVYRPASEAMPSVVASSDLLGPSQMPEILPLEAESLNSLAKRDPQENVKQFLAFQHLQPRLPDDTPPSPLTETPRFEMFPPLASPTQQQQVPLQLQENLRNLPKLSIPVGPPRAASQQTYRRATMSPGSVPKRLGTPASEMDIPVSAVELGSLDRDASQSVPPNMHFRAPVHGRPASRGVPAWRRPSMQLPTVRENVTEQATLPAARGTNAADYGLDTTQAGWMKKRKAKLLRHEWNDRHFRLHGTQLAMHGTDLASDVRALDSIDVDQYSVACSSLMSDSKLTAAMKSLRIAAGRKGSVDDTAFVFSLVPAAEKHKMMGLLREGGKSHHFMVATRDQRIDWMRSVMLAKAVRQKEQGCDVVINGEKL